MPRSGGWGTDALLYGASAAWAGGTAAFAGIPLQREWGLVAVAPYALGAVAARVAAWRGAGIRARVAVAAAVFAGAGLLPMALEVAWRAASGPGLHAQSEVLITEEAAAALVDGRNPYAVTFGGSLSARPLATRSHFPYPPAAAAFGLPRALLGPGPLTDARLWSAAAALGVLALALARLPVSREGRLRVAQVLAVLPTGAPLFTSGGADPAVLALALLALALVARGRSAMAGVAAGVAAALKQTAWPLLPFLALAALPPDGDGPAPRERSASRGHSAAVRLIAVAVALGAPGLLAFAVVDAGALAEDVVRFPLGLGAGPSPAAAPTLGSLVVVVAGGARPVAVAGLVVVVVAAGAALLVRSPRGDPAEAAWRAGLTLLLAIALAPAARLGYVVYPAALLMCGAVLRRAAGTVQP